MGTEIEYKFLLKSDAWRKDALPGVRLKQGYIANGVTTVRVRIAGKQAFLTLKGRPVNLIRPEYEYSIPLSDAEEMLENMRFGDVVEKIRYIVPAAEPGLKWEIDEYSGANAPLFTAEIEVPTPDTPFTKPEWLGDDVSMDKRYTNRVLSKFPYSTWCK